MAQADAPGSHALGRPREARRQHEPNKKAPRPCEACARLSSPRIEHRTRPPHPTPRIVTIAKRPQTWDGMFGI